MTVDAVPHDLAYEAADLLETGDTIEFGHTHRHLVTTDLLDQIAALRVDEPRLAGSGADTRIGLHALHQHLKVASWQVQIHVQFAEVVKVLQAHRLQSSIEG